MRSTLLKVGCVHAALDAASPVQLHTCTASFPGLALSACNLSHCSSEHNFPPFLQAPGQHSLFSLLFALLPLCPGHLHGVSVSLATCTAHASAGHGPAMQKAGQRIHAPPKSVAHHASPMKAVCSWYLNHGTYLRPLELVPFFPMCLTLRWGKQGAPSLVIQRSPSLETHKCFPSPYCEALREAAVSSGPCIRQVQGRYVTVPPCDLKQPLGASFAKWVQ